MYLFLRLNAECTWCPFFIFYVTVAQDTVLLCAKISHNINRITRSFLFLEWKGSSHGLPKLHEHVTNKWINVPWPFLTWFPFFHFIYSIYFVVLSIEIQLLLTSTFFCWIISDFWLIKWFRMLTSEHDVPCSYLAFPLFHLPFYSISFVMFSIKIQFYFFIFIYCNFIWSIFDL